MNTGAPPGLVVVYWTTDHYHLCSNLSMGISEDCFIFDFALLPLAFSLPCVQNINHHHHHHHHRYHVTLIIPLAWIISPSKNWRGLTKNVSHDHIKCLIITSFIINKQQIDIK